MALKRSKRYDMVSLAGTSRRGNRRAMSTFFNDKVILGIISLAASLVVSALAAAPDPTRRLAVIRTKFPLHSYDRFPSTFNYDILTRVRGGSDSNPSSSYSVSPPGQQQQQQQQQQFSEEYYQPPPQQQQQQQQPMQQQEQPLYDYEYPPDSAAADGVPFEQQTFQDKVDTWRQYQREHAEEQRSSLSPRDETGKLKLMSSVGKGSRAITFFILMWRNVHLYEVVDAKYRGNQRLLGVLPLTFLFVANMAGVVASVTSSGHSSKKRLKAILNLNKLVEVFLIVSYIGKLIFSTSNLVPREIYISNILHSVFFFMQCQAVTRFVWDEAITFSPQSAQKYQAAHDEDEEEDEQNQPLQRQRQPIQQQQQQHQRQMPIQNNPNYNRGPYNNRYN